MRSTPVFCNQRFQSFPSLQHSNIPLLPLHFSGIDTFESKDAQLTLSEYLMQYGKNTMGNAPLPLTHTTTVGEALEQILSREIKPTPTWVFNNKELVFAFPIAPEYRPHRSTDQLFVSLSQKKFEHPVSYVLSPEAFKSIDNAFLTDTGAHKTGINVFIKDFPQSDFSITSDDPLEIIKRYISVFFGNLQAYLRGESKIDAIPEEHKALLKDSAKAAIQSLSIPDVNTSRIHGGRMRVELLSSTSLPLSPETLLGIVVPDFMLDEPLFKDFQKENPNMIVKSYITYPRVVAPHEHHGEIYRGVEEIYEDLGFLKM